MKAGLKEKDVKFNIKELFKKYDVWYFMPSMNGYGRTGIPDFIACVDGFFLAVEAKGAGGKATINQERELAGIFICGGRALLINDENLNELESVVKELKIKRKVFDL